MTTATATTAYYVLLTAPSGRPMYLAVPPHADPADVRALAGMYGFRIMGATTSPYMVGTWCDVVADHADHLRVQVANV